VIDSVWRAISYFRGVHRIVVVQFQDATGVEKNTAPQNGEEKNIPSLIYEYARVEACLPTLVPAMKLFENHDQQFVRENIDRTMRFHRRVRILGASPIPLP
jgi:hypothetical protein